MQPVCRRNHGLNAVVEPDQPVPCGNLLDSRYFTRFNYALPGQVAQLVEQGTENPRVGGSIPSLATSSSRKLAVHRQPPMPAPVAFPAGARAPPPWGRG